MFYLRADSTAQWSLTKLALMYKKLNKIQYTKDKTIRKQREHKNSTA